MADQVGGKSENDLQRHYRTALTILFRLMFVAYAEDSRLLPLHVNGEYTDHALKTIARRLSHEINSGQELGFDNPLMHEVDKISALKGSALTRKRTIRAMRRYSVLANMALTEELQARRMFDGNRGEQNCHAAHLR